ncbi:hypothetical protein D3C84_1226320 [compost metagenome]
MNRLTPLLDDQALPTRLTALLKRLQEHFRYLDSQVKALDQELKCQLADNNLGRRLLTVP